MAKIQVGATIARTYRFAFGNFFTNLGQVWVSFVLLCCVSYVLRPLMSGYTQAIATRDLAAASHFIVVFVPVFAIESVLIAMQVVALAREALGLRKGPAWYYFSLRKPLWRLIGAYILLLVILFLALLVVVPGVIVGVILGKIIHFVFLGIVLMVIAYGAVVYGFVRLAFLLTPVIVAEEKIDPTRAWTLARGNFWRIFVIGLAVLIPILAVESVFLFGFLMHGLPHFAAPTATLGERAASATQLSRWAVSNQAWITHYWYIADPISGLFGVLFHGLSTGAQCFTYRALVTPGELPSVTLKPPGHFWLKRRGWGLTHRETALAALAVVVGGGILWRADARRPLPEPTFVLHPNPVHVLDAWTPAFAGGIRADLAAGRYANLDAMAASFRQPGEYFLSGIPKLDRFYSALSLPCGCGTRNVPTEAAFAALRTQLEAWRAADPQSITAEVALANFWKDYGWKARGIDYDDKVPADQWALARDRFSEADYYLIDPNASTDPMVYYLLIDLGMVRGLPRAILDDYYRRAVAAFPWYYPYYAERANFLQERWYGFSGEERTFLDDLRSPAHGIDGQVGYTFATYKLMSMNSREDLFTHVGLDFRAVIAAYQVREEQYGLRNNDWNTIFNLSVQSLDCMTGHVALTQIGDHWDPDVWQKQKYFDDTVKWFHQNSPY